MLNARQGSAGQLKFFVALLSYNSVHYIRDSVVSILNQNHCNWQLLICDDNSTDGTIGEVADLLGDSRITVHIQSKNVGQALNWAYAINCAARLRSEFQLFATLHADDAWGNGFLTAHANAFMQRETLDMSWCNWEYCDSNLLKLNRTGPVRYRNYLQDKEIFRFFCRFTHCLPSCTVVSIDALARAGVPDEMFPSYCDAEYFLRIACVARGAGGLDAELVKYRQHESSVTSTTHAMVHILKRAREILLLSSRIDAYAKTYFADAESVETYKRRLGAIIARWAKDAAPKSGKEEFREIVQLANAFPQTASGRLLLWVAISNFCSVHSRTFILARELLARVFRRRGE